MSTTKASPYVVTGILFWATAVIFGTALLWCYSSRPGHADATPQQWPSDSRIGAPEQMTLFMAVHPQCPCTRSSIAELARLMRLADGQLDCVVLINSPEGVDTQWTDTGLCRSAKAIPGVRTYIDDAGEEARRLGMVTSGAVVLFDAQGRLCFTGGITQARGHEGASAGRDAILALLDDPERICGTTPVFGCELVNPTNQRTP